jgi:hypothetical protein
MSLQSDLKMKAVGIFETFVTSSQTTPFYKPEDHDIIVVYLNQILRVTCIYTYFIPKPDFGMQ